MPVSVSTLRPHPMVGRGERCEHRDGCEIVTLPVTADWKHMIQAAPGRVVTVVDIATSFHSNGVGNVADYRIDYMATPDKRVAHHIAMHSVGYEHMPPYQPPLIGRYTLPHGTRLSARALRPSPPGVEMRATIWFRTGDCK